MSPLGILLALDARGNKRQANVQMFEADRQEWWAVAQSPIMVTAITLKRLIKRGYELMLNYYLMVSSQLITAVPIAIGTRPVAPMLKLRRKHTYSGHAFIPFRQTSVRGEPRQLQLARPSTRLAVGFYFISIISSLKSDIKNTLSKIDSVL